jgi:signal transduction histidine kinase
MWCAALVAYLRGIIGIDHFEGVSASVLYVVLINLPILYVLRRTRSPSCVTFLSILIMVLEIIGYTSMIYFLGGIEATYLVPIYAILISYLGIVAPRYMPYLAAAISSVCLTLMVLADYFAFIPHQAVIPGRYAYYPLEDQLAILAVVAALLQILAYSSSLTAKLLRRSKERLRRQNTELEIARKTAEKASKAKSDFLANMSHELRTPLNHIIGFTELVADKKLGELNETQEEYLGDALDSSKHLLSLINDILDLSKVEAGKMELELSDVDLHVLLENSLGMVKEKAIKHGIELSTDLDGVPEKIQADERKLKQVMYNLVSNAVKFTGDGGSITVSAELRLDSADGSTGKSVHISVTDTGIGLRPEDKNRIFDEFERAEAADLRHRVQGTGLGLSLTKKLVELHGGRIRAESEGEGKGSRFSFGIPIRSSIRYEHMETE